MATPDWSDDLLKTWADAQQNYWNAWSGMMQAGFTPQNMQNPMAGATGNMHSMPQNMWAKGLEQWWQAFNQQQTPTNNQFADVFQRVVDMGKHYMSMAENAFTLTSADDDAANSVQAWMTMMENSFKSWEQQLGMNQSTTQLFEAGQASMQGWQKVLDSMGMSEFGNNVMQQMTGFQMPTSENWNSQLKKMLSSATLGYARESQADMQELGRLTLEYQEAMDAYLKAFAEQGVKSIEALRERVGQLASEGQSISSLRELYDLWVDVNEEVYAEFANSDRYQVVYGDTVNTLMALKEAMNSFLDTQYQAANLPTRSEMNAAFKKQQATSRENRQLKKQLKDLARRVEALESAQDSSGDAGESKPVVKKAASAPKSKPKSEKASGAAEQGDDLTKIKGLGDKMSQKLADMGIQSFQQLSEIAVDQMEAMDKQLGAQGRMLRDDWIGQAKAMAEQIAGKAKS